MQEEAFLSSDAVTSILTALGSLRLDLGNSEIMPAARDALSDPDVRAWLERQSQVQIGQVTHVQSLIESRVRSFIEKWIVQGAAYGTVRIASE